MASTQEFRRRIKSVNNTKQITKAMEMVASVKMQKAIRSIQNARSYVQNSWNIFAKLVHMSLPGDHPLLKSNDSRKAAVIFITSDRGLCGAFNADMAKKINKFVKEECADCDIIAVGKKGADFVRNYQVGNLTAVFPGFENNIELEDVIPISKLTNGEYLAGKYSRVYIVYSHFVSSLKQTPAVKQILPINQQHIDLPELWEQHDESVEKIEFKFEPNADQILEKLLLRMLRLQILGAVLESNASEHSARMIAMKNATDNAEDLISDLTLTYNAIRQDSITREIAEISGAAEAMK